MPSWLSPPRSPGFGEENAYPTFELKAAVLLERLARNHPRPDGNKRAAFVVTVLFCESNGRRWVAPDAGVDAPMVERVAAGEVELGELAECTEPSSAPGRWGLVAFHDRRPPGWQRGDAMAVTDDIEGGGFWIHED